MSLGLIHWGLLDVIGAHWGLLEVIEAHWGLLVVIGAGWGLLGTRWEVIGARRWPLGLIGACLRSMGVI